MDEDEFEDTHETGNENQGRSATLSVLDVLRAPKPSAFNKNTKFLLIMVMVVNADDHRLRDHPHALSQRKLPHSKGLKNSRVSNWLCVGVNYMNFGTRVEMNST